MLELFLTVFIPLTIASFIYLGVVVPLEFLAGRGLSIGLKRMIGVVSVLLGYGLMALIFMAGSGSVIVS
ncbi:hypothetical protein [Pseudomonas indica]|uniref:DUF1538 domain-containing protein n=1 Tax=Pseudomonas indica TaxID=137658 RepID=A0A1G9JJE6_9PSED|nr:hypothetical protein [Pseudomonas indica]SDL37608.1 hypothetical protein SAMN05216186_11979 [Pseudomonas indica]